MAMSRDLFECVFEIEQCSQNVHVMYSAEWTSVSGVFLATIPQYLTTNQKFTQQQLTVQERSGTIQALFVTNQSMLQQETIQPTISLDFGN